MGAHIDVMDNWMAKAGEKIRIFRLGILLIGAILFSVNIAPGQQSGTAGCSCVDGQVIVQLNNAADLPAVAAQYGLNSTPISQVASPAIYLLQITNGQTPVQAAAALSGDVRVIFSEVNRKLSQVERPGLSWTQGSSWAVGRSWAVGGSRKGFHRQWFPDRIRLDAAFDAAGTRGRRVDNDQPIVVAVLDTGIDLTHPAFEGKLVDVADRWDFVDGDNDPSEVGILRQDPAFGHGTHVAGIVSLMVPDAKIMPLRILDRDGSGELWRITAAVIWAANHGADVANLSIGYPEDVRVLHDLLDCIDLGSSPNGTITPTTFPEIGTRRLAVAVASGNGGNTAEVFPAAEQRDGMLSVAASTRYDLLAPFSSYERSWVDVTAPGEDIVSTLPGGRYGMWSGTSMAAPIVAGLTALVKARYPTTFASPHDLLDHVAETSVDKRYNNGDIRLHRVDALCAITNNFNCPIPIPRPMSPGIEMFLEK